MYVQQRFDCSIYSTVLELYRAPPIIWQPIKFLAKIIYHVYYIRVL